MDAVESLTLTLRQFRAAKTAQGWAFQNVPGGRFLGIPASVGSIPEGTQASAVEEAFTWVVLPSPKYTDFFKYVIALL
jgi:hypothetical protein